MKFLDVKTDFAFKKVFGSQDSKAILINFLNALVEFSEARVITDLVIVDPYSIPLLKGMKDSFVDVKARLNDNSQVIIEMQVLNHEGLEKRILYNAAKNYSVQLNQGEPYRLLNPVIALTITDFVLFNDTEDLISHFKLLEKKRLVEYSDDIELIFIELPKFSKAESELQSTQDRWLYFIKNAGKLDCIPKDFNPEIQQAFGIANEANLSAEELDIQHKKRDFIYIQKSALELASKQALKQGLQQGEWAAKEQMVLNAHKIGLPLATISDLTGLDEQQINAILQNKA